MKIFKKVIKQTSSRLKPDGTPYLYGMIKIVSNKLAAYIGDELEIDIPEVKDADDWQDDPEQ